MNEKKNSEKKTATVRIFARKMAKELGPEQLRQIAGGADCGTIGVSGTCSKHFDQSDMVTC